MHTSFIDRQQMPRWHIRLPIYNMCCVVDEIHRRNPLMQVKKRWDNPALVKYTKYKCEKYIKCDPSSLRQSSYMYWLLQFTLL
jgi:hypothetical protein